jgi:hypothetical protein
VHASHRHRAAHSGESLNAIANIVVAFACIGGAAGVCVGIWLMFATDSAGQRSDADVLLGAAVAFGALLQSLTIVCVFRAIAVFGRYVAWRASESEG